MHSQTIMLFGGIGAILVLASLIGLILKPVRQLDRAIERLGEGDFATPIVVGGTRDLESIGGRLDWLRPDCVVDFKTTQDSMPSEFAIHAGRYGYHQQQAWYTDILRLLGQPALDYLIIAQCTEPPHLVSVNRIDAESVQRGRDRNRIALDTLAECRRTGLWPGHGNQIHDISIPAWA